ncbi:MAG: glutathione S-transferase [Robiginitomaculum sp.]|nr:MAG: glutathione S-transferase [Robiginitomaculum sp.]
MTMKLYHISSSRSVRPLWVLEELGLDYDLETLDLKFGSSGGENYKKIHPYNKVPALTDGDMTMYESVAIMQYIMGKYGHGHLSPKTDSLEYGPYLQWLHFGESSLAPNIVTLMYQLYLFKEEQRSEDIKSHAKREISKYLKMLEDYLGDKDYILESGFSAADISVGYSLLLLRLAQAKDLMTPRLDKYWKTITDRPSWEKISKL